MRRVAYALSVALCVAGLAPTAHADPVVTYTWETLSTTTQPGSTLAAPALRLSFEINGDVSFTANSDFASTTIVEDGNTVEEPSRTLVQYQFPPQLLAFNLTIGQLSVNLGSFTSSNLAEPSLKWNIGLDTNESAQAASLSFDFRDATDSAGFGDLYGDYTISTPAYESYDFMTTEEITTVSFDSDSSSISGICPCTYTGMLVARTIVPEPASLGVLLAGLGMLGLVRRRRGISAA